MIKIKGSEIAGGGTDAGDGINVGLATMVRCTNPTEFDKLITITTADEAATIGTFTIGQDQTEYVDKDHTDEIFAAHADILLASVIVV